MGIGAKLQKAIDNKRTNVNEIAKRANVNPSVLYSIIRRDSKSVDINVLITIASILGVPVEYFSDNYVESNTNEKLLMQNERDLLFDFRKLNSTGKDKATEYVHDLTENSKYKAAAEPAVSPDQDEKENASA